MPLFEAHVSGSSLPPRAFNQIAVDLKGNVLAAGFVSGVIEIDGAMLTGFGDYDALATKFDCDGNLLWADLYGADGKDRGFSLAVDSAGKSLFGGECDGAFPGPEQGAGCAMFLERRLP